jgi:hypothetical protein
VQEVAAVLPAARDERHRHPDRDLVVVARPAAVEVEADVPKRLRKHAVMRSSRWEKVLDMQTAVPNTSGCCQTV